MPRLDLMALRKPCILMWLTADHSIRGSRHDISLSTGENLPDFFDGKVEISQMS